MEWLLYFLIAISILMKCYLIFLVGRIFEMIVQIRMRPKGTPQKLYTVYNNKTDMPVIIDGTAKECAKAMGMKLCSFYPAVTHAKTGKLKKWYIESVGVAR